MLDDSLLYQRLKQGDQDALRELVARHHRPLFDFLFRLTDDRHLADDFAQQTFIRLLTHQGEAPQYLSRWLFTVARHFAYDYFRSAAYRREQMTDFSQPADDALVIDDDFTHLSPEMTLIHDDQQQLIAGMLQRLPPHQREVVILRFYHDLSLQAIAAVIEAPLGTVKSRLFHGLKKLKGDLIAIGQPDEYPK